MTARSSLLRHVAMTVGALVMGTLVVVAPSVEQRVAKASAVGLDDTFATFNGSNFFRAADNDTFDVTGNITVSAWIRPTSLCAASATTECVFVTKDDNYIFAIRGGTFQFALKPSSGSWDWRPTGVIPIVNQWQHVSFAVARSASTLTMYMNGRQVYSVVNSVHVPTTSNSASVQEFNIGARWSGTGGYFQGSIDEVRVYNTTRASEAQAQADMNTWGPANAAGLVLYYDFNEGSGSTLTNRVTGAASATNLTASGSPTWTDAKTTTANGGMVVVTFARTYLTSVGGWTVPSGVSSAQYLSVAGGGGGGGTGSRGNWSGGGGAGGQVRSGTLSGLGSTLQVTVGAGGVGGPGGLSTGNFANATEGGDSVVGSVVSRGGGRGGSSVNSTNESGGVYTETTYNPTGPVTGGGGGAQVRRQNGAAGSLFSGGNGFGHTSVAASQGGGGGAGAGANGVTATSGIGGAGGTGVSSSLSGSTVFYGGGGGGGTGNTSGNQGAGGNGGSGIVIVRYLT
jgi:hypothetical protein